MGRLPSLVITRWPKPVKTAWGSTILSFFIIPRCMPHFPYLFPLLRSARCVFLAPASSS